MLLAPARDDAIPHNVELQRLRATPAKSQAPPIKWRRSAAKTNSFGMWLE